MSDTFRRQHGSLKKRQGALGVLLLLWSTPGLAQPAPPEAAAPDAPVAPAQPAPAPAPDAQAPAAPEPPPPAEPAPPEVPDPAAEAPPEAPPESDIAGPESGVEQPVAEGTDIVVESGSGLFEESVAAPAESVAASDGAAAPLRRYELNGYVRGDVFIGKSSGADRAVLKAGYGELALEFRVPGDRYGDAFAEARLRYGKEGERNDLLVDLREAYVNLYAGPFDLRLGKQIVVWGRADAFNPTNNITPVDLRVRSPIEDDRRQGRVGARAFLNFSPIRVEGVWMPIYTPTEFPPFELQDRVRLVEPVFPSAELQDGLAAGRVHLELPAFEMSASYLYGPALLPALSLQGFSIGPEAEVRIQRVAYRHQVVGADFSTAVGDLFAVRGEAAYRKPFEGDASHTPLPELQYVLGLDRAFGKLNVIAQYVGKYVPDWQRQSGPDSPVTTEFLTNPELDPDRLTLAFIAAELNAELARRNQVLFQQTERIQHMASLRLEWLALHETLSLSAFGALNFSTEEWLLYPKVSYQFSDAMTGSIGGEIYYGPNDTLLDFLDDELTAGYAELRFSF